MKRVFLALFLMPFIFCVPDGMAADEISDKIIERKVDSVLSKLSTREKIAQIMIVDLWSGDSPARKKIQNRLVRKEKIGGIIIMDDALNPAVDRVNQLHRMAEIPLLVTIDGEWGASMRYPELHAFPHQMQLGALADESLIYEMGYAIGKECRDLNIHVNFAPDVDINNNADNPVINSRSFGENKDIVARYGAAYMEGMRDAGVCGSAKHFPGHGDTNADSHKTLPVLPFSRERLDSLELYPFRYLIDKNVGMVMVGHLEVPVLDSSGTPASISRPIITGVLKEQLGYDGIVITDALNMNGVSNTMEKKFVPLEAFKAGVDILLMPEDVEASITEIEKAVRRGDVSMADLNEKVRKMLRLKVEAGLFDAGYNPVLDTVGLTERVVKDSNRLLIEKLAKNSITVLCNEKLSAPFEDEFALPVGNLDGKKIGVLALGRRNSEVFANTVSRYAKVDTVSFDMAGLTVEKLREAREKLAGCNLVITLFNETDQRPNKNFGIVDSLYGYISDWAAETDMIAAYMGSPYAIARIDGHENFKGYVVGYTSSPTNCDAVAQIIFGGVAARGVLPVRVLDYGQGYSVRLEKTRLELRRVHDAGVELKNGVVCGEYLTRDGEHIAYDAPVELDFSAPLLTYIPAVAKLLDEGCFKTTTMLKHIFKPGNCAHGTILLSDLLMQRSGLPDVEAGAPAGVIENLHKDSIPQLQYSDANIYYLSKVVLSHIPEEELTDALDGFYASLGMYSTSFSFTDGYKVKVTTTIDDLAKFLEMLRNGGTYGGVKYLSAETARFVNMLVTYYNTNSNGFSIMNYPSGEVVFFYR